MISTFFIIGCVLYVFRDHMCYEYDLENDGEWLGTSVDEV